MSQTEVQMNEGTVPQFDAVEQLNDEPIERLRREKTEYEEEAFEWGKEEAREYVKDAPYGDIKEIVDTAKMPEDWDHIRDGLRENSYDETQVIRGFMEEIREVYESI